MSLKGMVPSVGLTAMTSCDHRNFKNCFYFSYFFISYCSQNLAIYNFFFKIYFFQNNSRKNYHNTKHALELYLIMILKCISKYLSKYI